MNEPRKPAPPVTTIRLLRQKAALSGQVGWLSVIVIICFIRMLTPTA
jgi:hypothetical protein